MKKSKIISGAIIIITLLVASSSMFVATQHIKKNKKELVVNYSEHFIYQDILNNAIYNVASQLDGNENGYFAYVDGIDEFKNTDDEEAQKIAEKLLAEWQTNAEREVNLHYYAINEKGKEVASENHDVKMIESNQTLQKEYPWYIKVEFNDKGEISIACLSDHKNIKSFNERELAVAFNHFRSVSAVEYEYDDQILENVEKGAYFKLGSPKNMTMLFAIPQHDKMIVGVNDWFSDIAAMNNRNENGVITNIIPFAGIAALIVMIIAFMIPYHYYKEIKLFELLARIKLEILAWSFVWGVVGVSYLITVFTRVTIYNEEFLDTLTRNGLADFESFFSTIMIMGPWFLFFFLVILAVYLIKYIFNKGFKAYFKENTLVAWLYYQMKKTINYLLAFDLNNPTNKALMKVVGVNFVVLICLMVVFRNTVFLIIVYSILLLVILRRKFDAVQKDYNVLFKATKKLSNGDFDIDIKEDLGMFNSLRDEFSNIRDGFKMAVNEEVKSQKMKTELVSNVSHDLKTPLTSIITYTDLLKQEGLDESTRLEYIATLDRNALRLKNIIEDLFEMSKVNSGNVTLNLVDVDIVSLIKQAQFECLEHLNAKQLTFNMHFANDKIVHTLDSSKTYRVFENLFTNIGKYALANTRVYIDVEEDEEHIQVIFRNISEHALSVAGDELVERFVQGDESRNSEGNGLGLAIAKSFIELQNGKFKVAIDGDLFKVIIQFIK